MHSHDKPIYTNIKMTELPESLLEIEGEVTADELTQARSTALAKAAKEASLPGFRKGHVPEKVLIDRIGEAALLEDAAEAALSHAYPHIILDHGIEVAGRPEINITKLAFGNPLGFKIKVPVFPKFDLPDYKKIAASVMKKEDDLKVTDKEREIMIKDIQRSKIAEKKRIAGDNNPVKDEEISPLDDAFVKELGNFKDVTDFTAKLTENMELEKVQRAKEKKRLTIGEEMIAKVKLDLPQTLVETELKKMRSQFEDDIKRMGIKIEDYMKHAKKSEDEIKKEWRPDAIKRASMQILLARIAREEKIAPDEKEIEGEAQHILEHQKDLDIERVRDYVAMMLTNEKVFQFLESQK